LISAAALDERLERLAGRGVPVVDTDRPGARRARPRRRALVSGRSALVRRAGVVVAGKVPWAVPAMAIGVALPPLALGVLGHFHGVHSDVGARCAHLLSHLAARR